MSGSIEVRVLLVADSQAYSQVVANLPCILEIARARFRIERPTIFVVSKPHEVDARPVAICVWHDCAVSQFAANVRAEVAVVNTAGRTRKEPRTRVDLPFVRHVFFLVQAGAKHVVAERVNDIQAIGLSLIAGNRGVGDHPASREFGGRGVPDIYNRRAIDIVCPQVGQVVSIPAVLRRHGNIVRWLAFVACDVVVTTTIVGDIAVEVPNGSAVEVIVVAIEPIVALVAESCELERVPVGNVPGQIPAPEVVLSICRIKIFLAIHPLFEAVPRFIQQEEEQAVPDDRSACVQIDRPALGAILSVHPPRAAIRFINVGPSALGPVRF